VDPVFGGIVVELQELVEILGDLRDRLGPLGGVVGLERLDRGERVLAVLGVPDLRERISRAGLGRLRETVENVGDLVGLCRRRHNMLIRLSGSWVGRSCRYRCFVRGPRVYSSP